MPPSIRTFRALRDGALPVEPTTEPIERAIERLFRTADGPRVLAWIVETTHAPCPPVADDRALREAEGARRFASNLRRTALGDHRNHDQRNDRDDRGDD